MNIENPRRILAVTLSNYSDQLSQVVKDLTGTHPTPSNSSLAGVTHDLSLKTAYYSATVPIWLDLIAAPSEWAAAFLSPEAKEVLNVLGGVIVVFPTSADADAGAARDLVRETGRVVKDGLGGWSWDGVALGVGVGAGAGPQDLEQWEEVCGDAGLEFVHVDTAGPATPARNEFREKTGIPRVLEALEANDWANASDDLNNNDDDDDDDDSFGEFEKSTATGADDPESLDLGITGDDADSLRAAILGAGKTAGDDGTDEGDPSEGDVEKVGQMMQRLLAAREAGQAMGEEQRRRLAARAVAEVMREL